MSVQDYKSKLFGSGAVESKDLRSDFADEDTARSSEQKNWCDIWKKLKILKTFLRQFEKNKHQKNSVLSLTNDIKKKSIGRGLKIDNYDVEREIDC